VKKINLFFILAFKEQTYIYDAKVKQINAQLQKGIKPIDTTLTWHYVMLSQYFNLYNFFEYEDKIEEFENAVIYHLPYGRDNIDTGVEKLLLRYRGKVPIVMRSYDAHSPLKLSAFYLDTYHDLALTYLQPLVNHKNRLFAQLSYDNHLLLKYNTIPKKRKFACIILRKEIREGYFEKSKDFKEISMLKTYDKRELFAQYQQIDVYGANWSLKMKNNKDALIYAKKHYIQNLYKFNFIIENAITDNYLSEKIFDTFLSLSVPVYLGTPVIEKYIPKACFVDIRNFKDNDTLIEYLENMPESEYNHYIENILKYREALCNDFSTKNNFALPVYKWYKETYKQDLQHTQEVFLTMEKRIESMELKKISFVDNMRYYYAKVRLFIKRVIK